MANRAPDFFRQLNEQLLEQLEEHARQPGRTGEQVLEWLEARGVKTSKSAVYRWLQDFRLEDNDRRTAAMARAKLASACEGDAQAVSDAALRLLDDRLLGALAGGEELTPKEIQQCATALSLSLKSKRELIDLREQVRQMEAKEKAALEAASRAAAEGADGDAVLNLIKVKLGIIQPGRPS